MSSNAIMHSVTVLTPSGRRQQVKVTPNTTLLQVLEEVCTKYGFNPKDYDLRHHNQILDVSSIFRFTSLPNNAQLEMTEATKQRQESPVTLGLQLESGERLTGVFTPSDTLWSVITTLKPEEEKMTHIVVIYMRQEIYGRNSLSTTTLRSLGLTGGRAMLRLLHKAPEDLRSQANVTVNLTPRTGPLEGKMIGGEPTKPVPDQRRVLSEEEARKPRKNQEDSKKPSVDPGKKLPSSQSPPTYKKSESYDFKGNMFEKLLKEEKARRTEEKNERKVSESGEVGKKTTSVHVSREPQVKTSTKREHAEKEEKEEASKVVLLGDRSAVAYNLNSVKPVVFEEEPDDFYDLTISDARMLLKEAKQLCADLEDAPLMTAAQRELEKDKKVLSLLHQYKKTVLRIKFPDRTVLQGTFSPVETISEVEKFVAGYLENPKLKFYLYTTPPKVVLKSNERLIECGCVPSSVLYLGINADVAEPPSQYLKSDVLNRLSTPSAAALTAFQSRGTGRKPMNDNKTDDADKRKWGKSGSGSSGSSSGGGNKNDPGPSGSKQWQTTGKDQLKYPKWFKPSK